MEDLVLFDYTSDFNSIILLLRDIKDLISVANDALFFMIGLIGFLIAISLIKIFVSGVFRR